MSRHPTAVHTLGEDEQLPDSVLSVSESPSTSTTFVTTLGDVMDGSESLAEKWISLSFTWSGRTFSLEIADSDRLDALIKETLVGSLMIIKDI